MSLVSQFPRTEKDQKKLKSCVINRWNLLSGEVLEIISDWSIRKVTLSLSEIFSAFEIKDEQFRNEEFTASDTLSKQSRIA